MPQGRPLMTIVIPVFNEEACLPALFSRLTALRAQLAGQADLELLYVDDGSTDRSPALLAALAEQHAHVRLILFSRNFGHQIAVTAGLDHARGDWVAVIDADLQDPPEALADMLALALRGHDVVYGQRRSRRGESWFKRASAAAFYRTLNRLCEIEIPADTGDFRIMSRRVVDALRGMRERHRFIRGMVPWIGFRSAAFVYDREQRHAGATKYPLRKMLRFAANAILSFSAKPLVIATRLGLLVVAAGVAGGLYLLYLKLFTNETVQGHTSMFLLVVLLGGFQILFVGLLGEYVARIFEEAKGRPLYIIAETRNLPVDGEKP